MRSTASPIVSGVKISLFLTFPPFVLLRSNSTPADSLSEMGAAGGLGLVVLVISTWLLATSHRGTRTILKENASGLVLLGLLQSLCFLIGIWVEKERAARWLKEEQ